MIWNELEGSEGGVKTNATRKMGHPMKNIGTCSQFMSSYGKACSGGILTY